VKVAGTYKQPEDSKQDGAYSGADAVATAAPGAQDDGAHARQGEALEGDDRHQAAQGSKLAHTQGLIDGSLVSGARAVCGKGESSEVRITAVPVRHQYPVKVSSWNLEA
jgi:hypothetical protein